MNDARDDNELVRASSYDDKAFAILYRRHMRRIYIYLKSKVSSDAEAEDLTSQTFIAALENLENYNPEGNFGAWLTRIAHNKCVDYFRKSRRIVLFDHLDTTAFIEDSMDIFVHRRLQMRDVQVALSKINPERAEALRLRIFGNLSHAEVGEIIGKSEGATKTLIWRAINDLKQYFNVKEACVNE